MPIMVKNVKKGKPGASAWQRGKGAGHATSLPGTARHGTATPGVHMEIIVKFSESLPCVKSPVSRTAGTISVVLCAENVLVRTSWK